MRVHVLRLASSFAACAVSVSAWGAPESSPVTLLSTGVPVDWISGAGPSRDPKISADGHCIVFISRAPNLTTNAGSPEHWNVFLRDRILNTTELISANASGLGAASDNAWAPSVSADGRFVAFVSAADNLTDAASGQDHVYVRDRMNGQTVRASVPLTGDALLHPTATPLKLPLCNQPLISGDGRWVFFECAATNMTGEPDHNGSGDVFVRDLTMETVRLVSVNAAGDATADAGAELITITPDGRFVLMVSSSGDLVETNLPNAGVIQPDQALYWHDRMTGDTRLISTNQWLAWPAASRTLDAVLSEDGRHVAFRDVGATEMRIFRIDLDLGEWVDVWRSMLPPGPTPDWGPLSMTGDGGFLAYAADDQIRLWDHASRINRLVSAAPVSGEPGEGTSKSPVLARDGSRLLFLSTSKNLDDDGAPSGFDIYAYDIVTGLNRRLIGGGDAGAWLTRDTLEWIIPDLSRDGGHAVFECAAPDMVEGDYNHTWDVFECDLATGARRLVSEVSPGRGSATSMSWSQYPPRQALSGDGDYLLLETHPIGGNTEASNPFPALHLSRFTTSGTSLERVFPPEPSLLSSNAIPELPAHYYDYVAAMNFDAKVVLFQVVTNAQALGRAYAYFRSRQEIAPLGTPLDAAAPFLTSADGSRAAYTLQGGVPNSLMEWRVFAIPPPFGTSAFDADLAVRFLPGGRVLCLRRVSAPANESGQTQFMQLFAISDFSQPALLSRTEGGLPFSDDVTNVVASANSRYVFFSTRNGRAVFRKDLSAPMEMPPALVCESCDHPAPTVDGQRVVYVAGPNPGPGELWIKDFTTGLTHPVVPAPTGETTRHRRPQFSPEGRFVFFESATPGLVAEDQDAWFDLFRYDLLLGETALISRNDRGDASANAHVSNSQLSANGRVVVFQSWADNLVPADYNGLANTFAVRFDPIDADDDEMEDDWEISHFGGLNRDGAGDFDMDGALDQNEFLAGTNPTNAASMFRIVELTMFFPAQPARIKWTSVPGRSYRVESASELGDPDWGPLREPVLAEAELGSMAFVRASGRRFLRVRLVE